MKRQTPCCDPPPFFFGSIKIFQGPSVNFHFIGFGSGFSFYKPVSVSPIKWKAQGVPLTIKGDHQVEGFPSTIRTPRWRGNSAIHRPSDPICPEQPLAANLYFLAAAKKHGGDGPGPSKGCQLNPKGWWIDTLRELEVSYFWVFPKIRVYTSFFSSISIGFSIIFTIHFGVPLFFGNTYLMRWHFFCSEKNGRCVEVGAGQLVMAWTTNKLLFF